MESDLHGISFTAVERDAKFETRYVKEVPFVNGKVYEGYRGTFSAKNGI